MIRTRFLLPLSACSLMLVAASMARGADKVVNLLAGSAASIVRGTAIGAADQHLARMTDGRAGTEARLPASSRDPVDIVYQFRGRTVSVQQLAILLPKGVTAKEAPAKAEILVSSLSPNAGFHTVRIATLQPTDRPQFFPLRAVGAKWVLIRLFPRPSSRAMRISEIGVLGRVGVPATRYAFHESPADAIKVLSKLKSTVEPAGGAEAALLADARDGKLDDHSFAEAALIASGVGENDRRKKHLAKIDALEKKARRALKGVDDTFERGDRLLKLLHDTALGGGYKLDSTQLASVLDDGVYNCVSSSTLYNILGVRLGLDVRAIEVPDHVFSILYDGAKHVDVETTSRRGFNPLRDAEAIKQFQAQTGFSYVSEEQAHLRREVGQLGLVAVIYYNRGVSLNERKQHLAALHAYFSALSLDAQFDSGIKNVLATIASWGIALSEKGEFAKALRVLEIGLELAPRDATLLNNRRATWGQWAESLMRSGDKTRALAVLRRAAIAVPDGNFPAMQSWVYIGPGEEMIGKEKWAEAFRLAGDGMRQPMHEDARQELVAWRRGLVFRWWNVHHRSGNHADAMKVLERGMQAEPSLDRFQHNLAYVMDTWIASTYQREGAAAAEAILAACLKRFPSVPKIRDVGAAYAIRTLNRLKRERKFAEMVATAKRARQLLPNHEKTKGLPLYAFRVWGQQLVEKQQWQQAIDVYTEARRQFPNDPQVVKNQVVAFDLWVRPLMDRNDWTSAVRVYDKALALNPNSDHIKKNFTYVAHHWVLATHEKQGSEAAESGLALLLKRYPRLASLRKVADAYVQRQVVTLENKDEFNEALQTIDRFSRQFGRSKHLAGLARGLIARRMNADLEAERWSDAVDAGQAALKRFPSDDIYLRNVRFAMSRCILDQLEARKWRAAVGIGERALRQFPKDKTLNHNVKFAYDAWARQYVQAKRWSDATKIYRRALQRFPQDPGFARSLESLSDRAAM